MAQFDPIAVKTGVPTAIGTDTPRIDLAAVAGLTTAALASGDACQVNGALTMQKALNTSTSPIVGVYDGTTGSVVREGVVVATMEAGVVLANGDTVYLSDTAGALTNVKPISYMLHEVGVVVSAAASKIMLQPKPVVALPWAFVWVANITGGTDTKIDAATGAVSGSYGAMAAPNGTCTDGIYVYTIGTDDGLVGNVYKFNAATGAFVTSWSVTDHGRWICYDGVNLYATSWPNPGGRVRQFSTAGVPGFVAVIGNYPRECCYDGLGYVWALNYIDNTVSKVRCSDGAVIGAYATGNGPYSCCVDGTNIWIANRLANSVTKLLLSTGAFVGTYGVGNTPYGICCDGTYVYTADGGAGTITKLLAATGGFVATFAGFANCYKLATYGAYLYVSRQAPTNAVVKAYCANGAVLWSAATGADPGGVCIVRTP